MPAHVARAHPVAGRVRTLLAAAVVGVLTFAPAASADRRPAAPTAADPPEISEADLLADLAEFNKIAADNGGHRATESAGLTASLNFVKGKLDAAGFVTRVEPFEWLFTHKGTNLIAEWPHGDPNRVVMTGAHLDSVNAGPGINDNASGSVAVLRTALAVAKADLRPAKRLRFAWWDAEEAGLRGSMAHVARLTADDKKKIEAYLNFDMVGQKDLKTWIVYDDTPALAKAFREYLDTKGVASKEGRFEGTSDHAPFKKAGVPVSGFGSGSDPCYHRKCDDITNVGGPTMAVSANAVAHQVWRLASASDEVAHAMSFGMR